MSDERIAALEADSAFQAERIRELLKLVAFQARHMDDGWVAHNQVALDVERLEAQDSTLRAEITAQRTQIDLLREANAFLRAGRDSAEAELAAHIFALPVGHLIEVTPIVFRWDKRGDDEASD